jgi:hypothetical protein
MYPYSNWSSAYTAHSTEPTKTIAKNAYYPYHFNWWREYPLQDKNYIRNNVAGYYPQKKTEKPVTIPIEKWDFAWGYVCSTIFPKNPQYLRDQQIIPQP